MARLGVTYQDVVTAANKVREEGKNVTIENVRAILGTGSIGTINNHLRKWKETQNTPHKIAAKENLPEELVSVLKGLWECVVNQAADHFTVLEDQYKHTIEDIKRELDKFKTNNRRWQKLFEHWQQEKHHLSNQKLTLEQALEFSHKENTTLQTRQDAYLQQLREKQERIDELNRLHKQSQENLEHFRESAHEQRLLDQKHHDQQKQYLQSEMKELNEKLSTQQELFIKEQLNHQSLQHLHTALEKNHEQSRVQLDQLNVKIFATEKDRNEHLHASQHWQNQYKESQKEFQKQISGLVDAQTEAKLLTRQLKDVQQLLQDAYEHNKHMGQEKLVLLQEKSQLEGQLKQIHKMKTE